MTESAILESNSPVCTSLSYSALVWSGMFSVYTSPDKRKTRFPLSFPQMDDAFRTVHHGLWDFTFDLFAVLFILCRRQMIPTVLRDAQVPGPRQRNTFRAELGGRYDTEIPRVMNSIKLSTQRNLPFTVPTKFKQLTREQGLLVHCSQSGFYRSNTVDILDGNGRGVARTEHDVSCNYKIPVTSFALDQ